MPDVPGDDPDVRALQRAARKLAARGLTVGRITNYVTQALARPALHLPETFTPTHQTGGLAGFPAIDLFAEPGTDVYPPEDGMLVWPHLIPWDKVKRVGGWTFYLQGVSGNTYFATHLETLMPAGRYRKTDVIGTVAKVPRDWWAAHVHHAKHRGRYDPLR